MSIRAPRIAGIDFQSDEWKRIRELLTARKAELLEACATTRITEKEADRIRGGIVEVTALLSLDEERKAIPSDIYK